GSCTPGAAMARAKPRQTGLFFPHCQIAQFDCSVCTSEEADEAGTYRDDPRRIDIGHNPDVDEPRLQHSTAKWTAKQKNDPNNKDERRLQGFFHCLSQIMSDMRGKSATVMSRTKKP